MSKTILVTGGAGYIGSHICKALSKKGYRPVVYDDLSHGNLWSVRWGPFVKGSIHDHASLTTTIEHYEPFAVIHLAGSIHAREAIIKPSQFYYNNTEGSRILLQALIDNGIGFCVFSSTAAVYGNPKYLPIDEDHPKAPLNAYGKSKWAVETMLEDFEHAYGLQFASLRYFNACGADPEGDLGESHPQETHLIPLAIAAAMEKRGPLSLFGNHHPTPDGTAIRDYVHVTDLAEAHILALEHLLEEKGKLCLNLGTGQGYSVLEVLRSIQEISGRDVPYQIQPSFTHDSSILVANATKALTLLGWTPRYSDLSTIIKTAWQWYLSQEEAVV
ncbi:MAG: UDP-glucose 4-epimerase GalE [Simkania sp.]|nr:UDP-glucose 4-epimerase GalE [Simkania sp.]